MISTAKAPHRVPGQKDDEHGRLQTCACKQDTKVHHAINVPPPQGMPERSAQPNNTSQCFCATVPQGTLRYALILCNAGRVEPYSAVVHIPCFTSYIPHHTPHTTCPRCQIPCRTQATGRSKCGGRGAGAWRMNTQYGSYDHDIRNSAPKTPPCKPAHPPRLKEGGDWGTLGSMDQVRKRPLEFFPV